MRRHAGTVEDAHVEKSKSACAERAMVMQRAGCA
jgi:hypothetical protein